MSLLSIFVLLCCTVVCDSSQTCSGDSCKKFQLNKEHFNKRFRGSGLYEISAPGHHDCVRNCFNLSPCKSTDYNRKEKMCKLNDVDSTQITASDFEQQNGAIFSDITAWPSAMAGKCGSRPCSKRQRCIPDKDTYRCADISCGGAPYIQNGKAVLLKPGKYLYGDTATVLCDKGFSPNQTTVQCSILEKWEKAVCVKEHTTYCPFSRKDCYVNDVWDYAGLKNITPSGYACESWLDHSGNSWVNVEWVPESTLAEAQNYCRNPTGNNWPLWCFSSNPAYEYELCGISQC